ncbi:hypothetical protein [Marinobacter antarcticus]
MVGPGDINAQIEQAVSNIRRALIRRPEH